MTRRQNLWGSGLLAFLIGAGGLSLAACGDDDDTPGATAGRAGSAGGRSGSGGTTGSAGGGPGSTGTAGSAGSGSGSAGAAGAAGGGAVGPGAALKCNSSGKNAFETYGSAFGGVRDTIIAAEQTSKEDGKAEFNGTQFDVGLSFNVVGTPGRPNLPTLSKNLGDFLVFVYGGPNNYQGRSMVVAHTGLQITDAQYTNFLSLITSILTSPVSEGGFAVPLDDVSSCFAPPLLDPGFKATIVGLLKKPLARTNRPPVDPCRKAPTSMKPVAFRTSRRAAIALISVAVSFVALLAFAHTKPGRPLLRALGGNGPKPPAGAFAGACPLGFDGAAATTPAAREAARKRDVAKLRGPEPAAARPALGFELDRTTRREVETWAAAYGVTCRPLAPGPDLDCSDVPPRALPQSHSAIGAQTVWFRFDLRDRLVGTETFRYTTNVELVAAEYNDVFGALVSSVGSPARNHGEPTVRYLSSGVLAQTKATFAFRDYRAEAAAMQVDYGKYVLKEAYQSLNLPAPGGRVTDVMRRPPRRGRFVTCPGRAAPQARPRLRRRPGPSLGSISGPPGSACGSRG
jgi:hypothetical protein